MLLPKNVCESRSIFLTFEIKQHCKMYNSLLCSEHKMSFEEIDFTKTLTTVL